jgi:hypothetical protein
MSVAKKALFSLLLIVVSNTFAETPRHASMLERTNALTAKLLELGKHVSAKTGKAQLEGKAWTEMSSQVEQLLSKEKSPAVLARVALVTRILLDYERDSHPGTDEVIVEVLSESWFGCIKNIKKIGGPDALAALEDIRRTMMTRTLDGAPSLALRKAREEVEQGLRKK